MPCNHTYLGPDSELQACQTEAQCTLPNFSVATEIAGHTELIVPTLMVCLQITCFSTWQDLKVSMYLG